ncbi:DeoR/GlpR family DNA-binding transcription regulator [Treponema primitia]|uniref:DeoR/GlpR family DNA-binding transcription regulator n=1 Tax=Treponema primitia TaxID=88058 RepID=UPI00397FE49E
MFAEERRTGIVKMVDQNGQAGVKELSRHFGVTEDCIRKDLAILEQAGRIRRTHGGAVRKRTNPHALYVAQRIDKNRDAKRAIAAKALKLIHPGDTVFLDISTANTELAELIASSDIPVTVVTNMVDVMLHLIAPCKAELIFLGGVINPGKDGFIGSMTIGAIENFHFDIAFMGVAGVDPFGNSVETYLVDDGMTKKAVLGQSREKYLLLETRKFNEEAPFRYAKLEDFTGLILETPLSGTIFQSLSEYNLEIL